MQLVVLSSDVLDGATGVAPLLTQGERVVGPPRDRDVNLLVARRLEKPSVGAVTDLSAVRDLDRIQLVLPLGGRTALHHADPRRVHLVKRGPSVR